MELSPYIYPLLVALGWGVLFVLIKNATAPPVYGMGISLIGGCLFLLIPALIWIVHNLDLKPDYTTWLMITAIGILRYLLGTWCLYQSVRIGDVSVSTPVIGSKVILVSLLAVLIGLEKLNCFLLAAVLLAAAGFYCITFHIYGAAALHRKRLIKSILAALGAMISWSFADILVKKIGHIQPLMITFGSLSAALIAYYIVLLALQKGHEIINMNNVDKRRYFLHGILSFGGVYFLLNVSLAKVGIIRTNIVISLWPVVASIVGYSYYKELLTPSKIIGAFLLVGSIMIVILS